MRLLSLFLLFLTFTFTFTSADSDDVGNPYNTPENATAGDTIISQFAKKIIEPTIVRFTKGSVHVGPTHAGNTYHRMRLTGSGTFWRTVNNIDGIWIDLRSSTNYTQDEYRRMGVVKTNERIIYNITYQNLLDDSFELVHAHGQTPSNWRVDGVPFITDTPLAPGEIRTYTYDVPISNAGTYFIRSHWGFNGMQGMHAPLIIQTDVPPLPQEYVNDPKTKDLSKELNDPETKDVLLYLEDWCLQLADGDDAAEKNDADYDWKVNRDPYICHNPILAYRGMWGEWNSKKRLVQSAELEARAQPGGKFQTCEAGMKAPEFAFAYFFANRRTFDDSPDVYLPIPGQSIRLRIINAASLTAFRVAIPKSVVNVWIISTDGHDIKPVHITDEEEGGEQRKDRYIWVGVGQRIDVYFEMPRDKNSYTILAEQEAPSPSPSNNTAVDKAKLSRSLATVMVLYSGPTPAANDQEDVVGTGLLSNQPKPLEEQESKFVALSGLNWTFAECTRNFTLDLNGYNGIRGINGLGWQLPPLQPIEKLSRNPSPYHVTKGDKVCIFIKNWDRELHTLHLHGHTFQVVNFNGVPLKGAMRDTVQIPASCGNVTICFDANGTPGSVHSLHSSLTIHHLAGMHTTIEYDGYVPITIPSEFNLDATAYGEYLQSKQQRTITLTATQYITNNYAKDGVPANDLTRVGLGVGLALGFALLFSWIFFAYAFYRYNHSHQYLASHAHHRTSISQQIPMEKLPAHQELEESQSQM